MWPPALAPGTRGCTAPRQLKDCAAVSANSLKKRLAAGEVLVGHLLAYPSPWLIEILGKTGYDFVAIDLEHEPINDESVLELVRAADAVGISTIARMPLSARVDPAFSAGVHGIQIPDVPDAAAARAIVEATRFAPLGRRTYYTQTRAASYGVGVDERDWIARANEELLIVAMIEDIRAVKELDAILEVDGIDAVHVGRLDLAQSMGFPPAGEIDRVTADVVERCRAAGKHVAVGVVTPWNLDDIGNRIDSGIQILQTSAWMITHAIADFLSQIEDRIPESRRVRAAKNVSPNPYVSDQPDE